MKGFIITLLLTITSISSYSQHFIGKTDSEISLEMITIHRENILYHVKYNTLTSSSILYKLYIPSIKDTIQTVYDLDSVGICYRYSRIANISGYMDVYYYLSDVITKVDETTFIDEAGIKWIFEKDLTSNTFILKVNR